MYTTDYFIRYVRQPHYARYDLKRGFSISNYTFYNTKREALNSSMIDAGFDPATLRRFWIAGRYRWAFALPGLCGFGPFETAEEAEAAAAGTRGYGCQDFDYVAIYTGKYAGEADGDGDCFKPTTLVKVVKLG